MRAFNIHCAIKGVPPGAGCTPGVQEDPADMAVPELRKVLVVDDEQDLADLAEALLSNYGLKVSVAYSAAQALRILERDPGIGAVFSDIMMPGMTGLELATMVRALYPKIKIVLTSGYTLPGLLAEQNQHYLYVAKPYRIETIIGLLRSAPVQ